MDFVVQKLKVPALIKIILLCGFVHFFSACQIMYLTEQMGGQIKILNSRVPVKKALEMDTLSAEEKKKIQLVQGTKKFAAEKLSLTPGNNYSQFVPLKNPYPTYVVNASPAWELKNHTWWFPFIGSLPYIGYFNPQSAKEKEKELQDQGLDTFLRGVPAFSYLGYLSDPIFSSFFNYSEIDLVETIIHESVHSTLFIKNSAEFNERMAVFIALQGTKLFYMDHFGPKAPQLLEIEQNQNDQRLFAQFITDEIKLLKNWYSQEKAQDPVKRALRLKEIQTRFINNVKPLLKTKNFENFENRKLNNAYLMLFSTYVEDLSDFEAVFLSCNKDLSRFLEALKTLQSSKEPQADLKKLTCAKAA